MSEKALARYYKILDGDERAKYLITKDIRVDVDLAADESVLWKSHEHAMISGESGTRSEVSLLDLKIELAERMLRSCTLCERRCRADRASGKKGHCGVLEPRISTEFLHMGEEPDLIPSHTVFFAGCTFNCIFCQNWDISTDPSNGTKVLPSELARRIERRANGRSGSYSSTSRNVNWVGGDPTPNLLYILGVLKECGTNLPQIWNSNMYMSEDTMRLLDGVVDLYLADYKYGSDACAQRLSNAAEYTRIIQRNHMLGRKHAEMIIRHLILPGHIECCTRPALTWIANNLGDVKVNVMAQYRPEHKARDYPDLARPIRASEYREGLKIAEELRLDLCD